MKNKKHKDWCMVNTTAGCNCGYYNNSDCPIYSPEAKEVGEMKMENNLIITKDGKKWIYDGNDFYEKSEAKCRECQFEGREHSQECSKYVDKFEAKEPIQEWELEFEEIIAPLTESTADIKSFISKTIEQALQKEREKWSDLCRKNKRN
jgi:hypothetical protein